MKGDIKKVTSPRRYEIGSNSCCWLGMAEEIDGIQQSLQTCWSRTSGLYADRLRGGRPSVAVMHFFEVTYRVVSIYIYTTAISLLLFVKKISNKMQQCIKICIIPYLYEA